MRKLSILFLNASTVAVCLLAVLWELDAAGVYLSLTGSTRIELIAFSPTTFLMGRPKSTSAPADTTSQEAAQPEHKVSLSAFSIGKYPITVEQYCEFLNAVGFRAAFTENRALLKDIVEKPRGRFTPRAARVGFPITYVIPAGAMAFCDWVSKVSHRKCRLPTEAEWEFAAKGVQGRTYPWGETLPSGNPFGAKVGENPALATPEGVEDLNGPVYQYCLDMFDGDFYKSSPVQDPVCTNGVWHVVRGGPMFMFMEQLRMPATWKRFHALETNSLSGFRIVVEGGQVAE